METLITPLANMNLMVTSQRSISQLSLNPSASSTKLLRCPSRRSNIALSSSVFSGSSCFTPLIHSSSPSGMQAYKENQVVNNHYTFDWREKGFITPARDQGNCGCSYTCATTAAVESCYAIQTGRPISLSIQQSIDCDNSCYGCSLGGLELTNMNDTIMNNMNYILRNGLHFEKDYPFIGAEGVNQLPFIRTKPRLQITGIEHKDNPTDEEIIEAIRKNPIVVGIDQRCLHTYRSGVISGSPLNAHPRQNHSVLLVGYGEDYGFPYYIGKNSWGAQWGEGGFFKIDRRGTAYGINTFFAYPLIDKSKTGLDVDMDQDE